MSKKLIGKKARVIGLLVLISAAVGFFNSGIQTSVGKQKLHAFNEYFSQKDLKAETETARESLEGFARKHFQRGFDKLDSLEQADYKSNVENQILAASAFRYICLLFGVTGLIVWAQKDVALKLFYPSVLLVIASQFSLNFFTFRSNQMISGFVQGLPSQIITAVIASLVSITMIINLVLLVVVPLMTDESKEEV